MKGVEISEVEGIIKLIDERADDLLFRWGNKKPKMTKDLKARLFRVLS